MLSLAIASGGILISSHLRTTYKADFISSLLFFQVFWFTFGFYAPWGQIMVVSVLKPAIEPENLEKITSITLFLGSPFLVFAWLMFLKLTREISNRKSGNLLIVLFLAFQFHIYSGHYISDNPAVRNESHYPCRICHDADRHSLHRCRNLFFDFRPEKSTQAQFSGYPDNDFLVAAADDTPARLFSFFQNSILSLSLPIYYSFFVLAVFCLFISDIAPIFQNS